MERPVLHFDSFDSTYGDRTPETYPPNQVKLLQCSEFMWFGEEEGEVFLQTRCEKLPTRRITDDAFIDAANERREGE